MQTPPPAHPHAGEAARCDIAARRVRMLDGMWLTDAEEALSGWFAAEVQAVLPRPEMSRDPLLDFVTQITSMMYQEPYGVQVLGAGGAPVGEKAMVDLATLGAQQELSRYLVGCNECPLRLDVDDAGAVTCRAITPDLVVGWPLKSDPSQFGKVEHLVIREIGGKETWTWDRWDVMDPENPVYQVIIYGDRNAITGKIDESDVTQEAVGFTGWPKRYTDKAGAAVLPWVQYHRYTTPRLWNPTRGAEAVAGTLTMACLWTGWTAGVREMGFPTKAIIDGTVQGGTAVRRDGTSSIQHVVSPMALLQIHSRDAAFRASLGSWPSSFDAASVGTAISEFEAGLAASLGLSAADVTRGGGNGMSGYALVVSRDGLRRQWARIQVPLAVSDQIRLAKTAALTRSDLPTDPLLWRVTYPPVQDSPQEEAARVDKATKLFEAGIITRAEAYMMTHPGIGEDEAEEEAAEAEAEHNARLAAAAPKATPPGAQPSETADPESDPEADAADPATTTQEGTPDA